jgi:hypothetical protein
MTRSTSLGLSKGCATSTGRDSTSTLFASKLLILDSYFTVLNLFEYYYSGKISAAASRYCVCRKGRDQSIDG